MTPEEYQKILEYEIEKQAEGRRVRSTKGFYDKFYWGERWTKMCNAQLNESDPITKKEIEKKIAFIEKYCRPFENTLDVGCGIGLLTAAYLDRGKDAWGIDVSGDAIELAPEKVKSRLLPVSALRMDEVFEENKFDLVTCFNVLEHLYIEELTDAVYQINRVAKNEIVIRVPVPEYNAEPGITDFSYLVSRDHVSVYPPAFWARRFDKYNKFYLWMYQVFVQEKALFGEAWLYFRRR